MNDSAISGAGKADLERFYGQSSGLPDPAQPAMSKPPADRAVQAAQSEQRVQDRSAVQEKAAKAANPLSDVSLKFRVDAKTNEVSILILDRASRKVLRTIPPDEMKRMDPGELLELFT